MATITLNIKDDKFEDALNSLYRHFSNGRTYSSTIPNPAWTIESDPSVPQRITNPKTKQETVVDFFGTEFINPIYNNWKKITENTNNTLIENIIN